MAPEVKKKKEPTPKKSLFLDMMNKAVVNSKNKIKYTIKDEENGGHYNPANGKININPSSLSKDFDGYGDISWAKKASINEIKSKNPKLYEGAVQAYMESNPGRKVTDEEIQKWFDVQRVQAPIEEGFDAKNTITDNYDKLKKNKGESKESAPAHEYWHKIQHEPNKSIVNQLDTTNALLPLYYKALSNKTKRDSDINIIKNDRLRVPYNKGNISIVDSVSKYADNPNYRDVSNPGYAYRADEIMPVLYERVIKEYDKNGFNSKDIGKYKLKTQQSVIKNMGNPMFMDTLKPETVLNEMGDRMKFIGEQQVTNKNSPLKYVSPKGYLPNYFFPGKDEVTNTLELFKNVDKDGSIKKSALQKYKLGGGYK